MPTLFTRMSTRPKRSQHGLPHPLHVLLPGRIGGDGQSPHTPALQLLDQGVQGAPIARGDRHVRPLRGQGQGDRPADPLARPGDQGDLAGELLVHGRQTTRWPARGSTREVRLAWPPAPARARTSAAGIRTAAGNRRRRGRRLRGPRVRLQALPRCGQFGRAGAQVRAVSRRPPRPAWPPRSAPCPPSAASSTGRPLESARMRAQSGSRAAPPISWMCPAGTSSSHSRWITSRMANAHPSSTARARCPGP